MIKFTTKYINVISFVISIIIFISISNFKIKTQKIDFKANFIVNQEEESNIQNSKETSSTVQKVEESKNDTSPKNEIQQNKVVNSINNSNNTNMNWYIEIPEINLKAEIREGTTKEIMDKYVGHFEETSKTTGNIGLAAHNRGYENNYFAGLKKLKEGSLIKYKNNNFQKTYVVTKHIIIKDTDWTVFEKGEKNTITLITCVENEPEYRRCIQAVEQIKF